MNYQSYVFNNEIELFLNILLELRLLNRQKKELNLFCIFENIFLMFVDIMLSFKSVYLGKNIFDKYNIMLVLYFIFCYIVYIMSIICFGMFG